VEVTDPAHIPKPPGLSPEYAAQFADESVADAYEHRPPYPKEVFEILSSLVRDKPPRVLDIGCGRGEIARHLLSHVDAIDAVDASAAMIERGKRLPGGDDPRLRWIVARMEEAPLDPPYGLVVAASSLHWMDWDIVLPRLREVLASGAFVALLDDQTLPPPWDARLHELILRYSTNRDFRPYKLVDELEKRGHFRPIGSKTTTVVPFSQPLGSYIDSIHSRNGFSRDRMTPAAADAFDGAVREAVRPWMTTSGDVELSLLSTVCWGIPCP
jgi:SAM-dependent methyltransferase